MKTREEVKAQLRLWLGENAGTEQLLDWLEDAWETLDTLRSTFGQDEALRLLTAPSVPPLSFRSLFHDLTVTRPDQSTFN
jgi:hypothetical protein